MWAILEVDDGKISHQIFSDRLLPFVSAEPDISQLTSASVKESDVNEKGGLDLEFRRGKLRSHSHDTVAVNTLLTELHALDAQHEKNYQVIERKVAELEALLTDCNIAARFDPFIHDKDRTAGKELRGNGKNVDDKDTDKGKIHTFRNLYANYVRVDFFSEQSLTMTPSGSVRDSKEDVKLIEFNHAEPRAAYGSNV